MGAVELLWIAGWLICAFMGATVATRKGRGRGRWFFLGLLTGPIGLLAALVARPYQPGLDAKRVLDGTSKACPYCAEIIRSQAIVCRFCDRSLTETTEQEIEVPDTTESVPEVHELTEADIEAAFEQFLIQQGLDAATMSASDLQEHRQAFDELVGAARGTRTS